MDLNGFGRDDQHMFAPYCSRHGHRVLLGYESVIAIEQTPTGPKILLHCHCGELLAHDTEPARDHVVQGQTRVPAPAARVNVGGRACLSPARCR